MTASSALDFETRSLLQDGIARFSREHRANAAGDGRMSWDQMVGNGWLGLGMPDDVGGSGAAVGDLFPLMRAAGECLWTWPLVESLGLACGALLALPSSPPRNDALRRIAEGEAIIGMAGAAHCPAASMVKAHKTTAGVVLNGCTGIAVDGQAWDEILIPVVTDITGEVGLAAVSKAGPGVLRREVKTIDDRRATIFILENAPAVFFEAGEGPLVAAWQRGSLLAAAESAGIAKAALEAAKSYLALRKQFGQPIVQFQAIQHRLVEMHIREYELSALLNAASQAFDTADPALPRLLLQLRAQCSKAAVWITQQAIQLHGGMGMTQDLPIGGYYKRVLFIDSLFGSYEDAIDQLCAMSDFPNIQEH